MAALKTMLDETVETSDLPELDETFLRDTRLCDDGRLQAQPDASLE